MGKVSQEAFCFSEQDAPASARWVAEKLCPACAGGSSLQGSRAWSCCAAVSSFPGSRSCCAVISVFFTAREDTDLLLEQN